MERLENKERCFSCKDFGSGFENKKDSFKQRELKRLEEEQYKARLKELKDEKDLQKSTNC